MAQSEIVDLPMKKMVDLSIATLVYQRVTILKNISQWEG